MDSLLWYPKVEGRCYHFFGFPHKQQNYKPKENGKSLQSRHRVSVSNLQHRVSVSNLVILFI